MVEVGGAPGCAQDGVRLMKAFRGIAGLAIGVEVFTGVYRGWVGCASMVWMLVMLQSDELWTCLAFRPAPHVAAISSVELRHMFIQSLLCSTALDLNMGTKNTPGVGLGTPSVSHVLLLLNT
jgi:hypothetical protein